MDNVLCYVEMMRGVRAVMWSGGEVEVDVGSKDAGELLIDNEWLIV